MRFRAWLAPLLAGLFAAGPALAQAPTPGAPATPEQLGFSTLKLGALDLHMNDLIGQGQISGGVLLLARHGRVVMFKAYGAQDLASAEPMRPDALFRIRSETKPVTGVAMLMLYEEGKWALDDPVTKYIPEFANLRVANGVDALGQPILTPIARPPTMRELMTHTAGFAYGLARDGQADTAYYDAGVLASNSLQAMIDKIAALPMFAQPGTLWRYSAAVDIQGYIVEKLSGEPLDQFMDERIFKPLGMRDTGFYVAPDKADRLATLYDVAPDGKLVSVAEDNFHNVLIPATAPSGGGGLVSTAEDFARFCQMILNGGQLDGVRLLKPETVALMRTNQLPPDFTVTSNGIRPFPFPPGMGYGLDIAVAVDPASTGAPVGPGTISWGGSAGSWFWIDPVNDLFFIGMIQRLGGVGGGLDAASRSLTYQALTDSTR